MKKNDLISVDSFTNKELAKINIDEKVIAKWTCQSIGELQNEFKSIELRYDKKFEALDKDRRVRYQSYFNSLVEARKQVKDLIDKSNDKEERKEYFRQYLEINAKLDTLFAVAEQKTDEKEAQLIEMKKKDENKKTFWAITKAVAPIASKAIIFSLTSLLASKK